MGEDVYENAVYVVYWLLGVMEIGNETFCSCAVVVEGVCDSSADIVANSNVIVWSKIFFVVRLGSAEKKFFWWCSGRSMLGMFGQLM